MEKNGSTQEIIDLLQLYKLDKDVFATNIPQDMTGADDESVSSLDVPKTSKALPDASTGAQREVETDVATEMSSSPETETQEPLPSSAQSKPLDEAHQPGVALSKLAPTIEAPVKPPNDDMVLPILWNGNQCGCVPETTNVVYGFYPEEMATKEEQKVDFSVLSRIGYQALTFDENGTILPSPHWKKEKPYSNFINEAHRYRSKIDLVLTNDHWEKWGELDRIETGLVIDELVKNIVGAVTVPLDNNWLTVMKPYISFGFSPLRTMGDGVTLDFHFEVLSLADQQKIFPSLYLFVKTLRDRLDEIDRSYALNMMVPIDNIMQRKGVYALSNLQKMVGYVDLFLVMLDNSPDGSVDAEMEQLRIEVEKQFLSIEEKSPNAALRTMVRKMVPVITQQAEPYDIDDTLVYVKDNFKGVGLQPIPIGDKSQARAVNMALNSYLYDEDGVAWICPVVCTYRWILRTIIFLVFIFGLGYGLLSIVMYNLRSFYTSHAKYFVVGILLTLIVLLLTFFCDPFWKERQSELISALFIFGNGMLIWKLQKRKEGSYP
ncbi:MAG: hypothetical protein GKS05_12895 [Nitrospirales bacterium]|nr:hypothetical protein [Nitrospirales bacterium]